MSDNSGLGCAAGCGCLLVALVFAVLVAWVLTARISLISFEPPDPCDPDSATGEIAFVEGPTLGLVHADGCASRMVMQRPGSFAERSFSWSEDGSRLAVINSDLGEGGDLRVWSESADSEVSIDPHFDQAIDWVAAPQWQPTGDAVWVLAGGRGYAARVLSVPLRAGEPPVALPPANVTSFGWSPDGLEMAYTDELGLSIYNSKDGTTVLVGDNVQPWDYDWGGPTEIVFVRSGDLYLLRMGEPPFAASRLTDTPAVVESEPKWSPDLSWVAVSAQGSGIWIISTLDRSRRQLTVDQPDEGQESGAWSWQPRWSPDGRYLTVLRASYAFIFTSARIWRFEIDASDEDRVGFTVVDLSTTYCTPWLAACSHAWRPAPPN